MADSGLESPQSPSVPPTPDSSSTAAGPSTPPKPPTPANPSTPASPPTPASSSTPPNPPSGAPKPPGPLNLQARPPSLPESLLSSLPEGGLLFSGWYTQRVWVQECQSYRDQIQVDDGETEARRVIKSMMRKCKKESVFPSVQRELLRSFLVL